MRRLIILNTQFLRRRIAVPALLVLVASLSPAQYGCATGCGPTVGVTGVNLMTLKTSFGYGVGPNQSCQTSIIGTGGDLLEMDIHGPNAATVCLLYSTACTPGGCVCLSTSPSYSVDVGDPAGTPWYILGDCLGGSAFSIPPSGVLEMNYFLSIPPANQGPFLCVQAGILSPAFPVGAATSQAYCIEAQSWCEQGAPLMIGDDDFAPVPLGSAFSYYGTQYTTLFVNSNGSLSFGAGSSDPTPSMGSFLSGPPRIAATWFDWDPTLRGAVTVDTSDPMKVCVAWDRILPSGAAPNDDHLAGTVCVELNLLVSPQSGIFSVAVGPMGFTDLPQAAALVGISPGGGLSTAGPIDLSAGTAGTIPGSDALYELLGPSGANFDLELRALHFVPTGGAVGQIGYSLMVTGL